jgi:hypothetical protein
MTTKRKKPQTSADPFDIDTPPDPAGRAATGPIVQSPLRAGNKVFIRAVTFYYTGEIVGLTGDEVILSSAAWIAATGRYAVMLKNGAPDEIEPYPDGVLVSIGRGAIVDACDWKHPLPRSQK